MQVSLVATAADGVVLRVLDDGIGIGHPTRSSGTANITGRAREPGGHAAVGVRDDGRPGTQVHWQVPLPSS